MRGWLGSDVYTHIKNGAKKGGFGFFGFEVSSVLANYVVKEKLDLLVHFLLLPLASVKFL